MLQEFIVGRDCGWSTQGKKALHRNGGGWRAGWSENGRDNPSKTGHCLKKKNLGTPPAKSPANIHLHKK